MMRLIFPNKEIYGKAIFSYSEHAQLYSYILLFKLSISPLLSMSPICESYNQQFKSTIYYYSYLLVSEIVLC